MSNGDFDRKLGVTWDEYVKSRFKSMDEALKLSRDEMNRRLEGMNEIRSQLDRQAAGFITREAVDALMATQAARIQALERAAVGAAVTVVVGVVVWILTKVQ